jgi:large subunit ribosomal protein L22
MGRTFEETGLVRAQARFVRSSARKARLVLEHIRGRSAAEARVVLAMSTRDVARDVRKVLDSAIANATNNHGLDEETLVIHEAYADEGMTWKLWRPRARGRAMRIRKRTSHITILLRAVEPPAPPEPVEEEPKRRRSRRKAEPAAAPEAAVVEETPAVEESPAEEPEAEVVAEPEAAAEPEAEPEAVAEPEADAGELQPEGEEEA